MWTSERDSNSAVDPYARSSEFVPPPRGVWATLRQLGPGMILVGSVVGSGELIMTTKLGAVAGFGLLWFVLLSCFVKVIVQAELARHTISSGKTFLTVFNSLPGPAVRRPVWLTLPWMAVVLVACAVALATYVQLGAQRQSWFLATGLVAGVVLTSVLAGWAVSVYGVPRKSEDASRPMVNWFMWLWLTSMLLMFVNSAAILGGAGQAIEMAMPGVFGENGSAVWAIVVAVFAASLLLSGAYGVLEKTLIALVASFTMLTVICTVLLQWTGFAITWADIQQGFALEIPRPLTSPLILTALAMFAGTGVAFGEMWAYTYWCVEKGYARNVGEPQPGQAWANRARGWIRVMYTDVWVTMVVYTASTVCFYFLGAAILYAKKLDPDGPLTISILSAMYTDSLGSWAATLFVVGAFFVLFTTVLAGVAGVSRLMADALGVIGIIDSKDYTSRLRFIRVFIVVFLCMTCIAYWLFQNPPQMLVVTSTIIAATMYPILGLGVLYLRHYQVDRRILPRKLTTVWLWICGISLAVISPGGVLLILAIKNGWIAIGS